MENEITNLTLEELSEIEGLSVRTQNICRYNELLNVNSILGYSTESGGFQNLRNCGTKSQSELLYICNKYGIDVTSEDSLEAFIKNRNYLNTKTSIKTIDEDVQNLSLDELSELESLNLATKNFCVANKLLDLENIISYYKKNGNFLVLKRCRFRINSELIKLCSKYKNFSIVETQFNLLENFNNKIFDSFEDFSSIDIESNKPILLNDSNVNPAIISLEELAKLEGLNVRNQNICKYNRLLDLNSILEHYLKYGTFLNIRNCGKDSDSNLRDICSKYRDLLKSDNDINNISIEQIYNNKQHNPLIKTIDSLSARQKQIINYFIEIKLKILSVRGSNAIKSQLKGDYTLNGFRSVLLMSESQLMKIQFVGITTINEIVSFVNEVNEYIELVSTFENESEISFEVFKTYLYNKFSIENSKFEEIATDYDFSNGLPIFKTINILLNDCCLFEERETEIFKLSFGYYNDIKSFTLYEIGEKLNITRERTRQLKVSIYKNINTIFEFIKELGFNEINLYGIDNNSDYIAIDKELETKINKNEHTNFNSLFITKILSIVLINKYTLIGDERGIIFDRMRRNLHNWSHTYLVSNKYCHKLDFVQFIENVNNRLLKKTDEDYFFHFQTYLLEFQIEDCRNEIDNISQIGEYILFQECGLIVNIEDNIVFKRNTHKPLIGHIYEIFKDRTEPLTVYEIFDVLEQKHPEIATSPDSIRACMGKASDIISFGKSSTYGLKIWEDEQSIKGGTIRDIVEKFLENQDTPIHIDKVTEYVNQFRNTNSKSIYTNLKLHEDKKFSFFRGLLVGLTVRKYNDQNLVITKDIQKDRKTFEENFFSLILFTEKNGRLPSSNGYESEVKLYRFMNVQLNRAIKQPDMKDNSSKVLELVSKHSYVKRSRQSPLKIDEGYAELEKFISLYRRLPISRINDEKLLYNFYLRQRKLYTEQNLPLELKEKFLDIVKSLECYYEN